MCDHIMRLLPSPRFANIKWHCVKLCNKSSCQY